MLAASLALSLLAPATILPPGCKPPRPAHCYNADLVWSPEFRRAMRRFVGSRRGDYISIGKPYVHQQLVHAFGTVNMSKTPVRIAPGLFFIEGCVPHSCVDRAGAILSATGEIQAVGLSRYNVSPRNDDLDIFVARSGTQNRPMMKALRKWAWYSPMSDHTPPDKIRIHFIREGKTKTVSVP